MTVIFDFLKASEALDNKLTELGFDFEKFKTHYYPDLAYCIEDMNWKFGAGEISEIILSVGDCDIENEVLYGKVVRIVRRNKDERFFKVENGHVVFLSHKRKLKNVCQHT